VSDTAIAIDFYETLDVKSYLTAKVTLHAVVSLDLITESRDFTLGKVLCTSIRIDAGLGKDILRALETDTVDISERDFYALVVGNINTSYTSHFDIYSFLKFMSSELQISDYQP
jgi:hypothetical protein